MGQIREGLTQGGEEMMRHAIACFLHADTIDYLKQLARVLSKKRQCDVSASEAIEYLVAERWRQRMKKKAMKRTNAVAQPSAELR